MRKLLALLTLLAAPAFASQSLLTGTIRDSQGNGITGTLVMTLAFPAQDTTTDTVVANTPVFFSLANGSVSGGAPLYDVADLEPSNLYYIARAYSSTGMLVFAGNFAVTGATFNIGAATPTSVTTSNVSYILPIFPNQANSFTAVQTFIQINSANSPIAQSGFERLANVDYLCFRNATNTGDDCLTDDVVTGHFPAFTLNGGQTVTAYTGSSATKLVTGNLGTSVTAPMCSTSTGDAENCQVLTSTGGSSNLDFREVAFTTTLSGGTKSITLTGGAVFPHTPICWGNDTTALEPVSVQPASTSSIVIAGTGSDVVNVLCMTPPGSF